MSREAFPPESIVMAKIQLERITEELDEKLKKFYSQKQKKIIELCNLKSQKGTKTFWQYVSNKSKCSTEIEALQDKNGVLLTKPHDICTEVHAYLKQIFTGIDNARAVDEDSGSESNIDDSNQGNLDIKVAIDHPYSINPKPVLTNTHISNKLKDPAHCPNDFLDRDFMQHKVKSIIADLGNGKAAGWDNIPNEAVKETPILFLSYLTILFNRVKHTGHIPVAWKRGRLVLIHKKGTTLDILNYQPLTVLVVMSSIYTKLLNNRLSIVVEEHKLLGEIQNGFRKGRSASDCGFILNTILWKSMSLNKWVHLAFLDFQKAYDSVDRSILWNSLKKMGFGKDFLHSLLNLYQGDNITCATNGTITNPVFLGRGLWQGCSLSPMLFALYVAEMGQDLSTTAYGVKLFRVIVNAIFFTDDIVLILWSSKGLRKLLSIVQKHAKLLRIKLSVPKYKVLSECQDTWEIFEDDTIIGCLDKVIQFRYLGFESMLSPFKGA